MAYYNPDTQNSYYDPDDNTARYDDQQPIQPREPDQSNTGLSILKSLAAFTLGTMAIRRYGGKGLDIAVRQLSNVAKPGFLKTIKSPTLKSALQVIKPVARVADDIVSKTVKGSPVVLRDVLRGTPKVNKIFANYEKSVASPRKAYQEYLTKTQVIKSQLEAGNKFNNFEFMSKKISAFMDKQGVAKRTIGAAEKWGTEYLKALPTYYAVDRFINAKEYAGEKPSLLNVPGTLLDFAKFGIEWAPSDIGFSAAFKGLSLAKFGITKSIQKILKPHTKDINRILDSTTDAISSKVKNVQAHFAAAKPIVSKLNHEIGERFRSKFIGRKSQRAMFSRSKPVRNQGDYFDKMLEMGSKYKTELRRAKRRIFNTDGIVNLRDGVTLKTHKNDVEFLQSIQSAYKRVGDSKNLRAANKTAIGNELLSVFTQQTKQGRVSTIGSLLNRKPLRRDRSKYSNAYTKFFKTMVDDFGADAQEIDQIKNAWMKSSFGSSTFKSSSNVSKMVDFSYFNPVNLLKVAPRLLSKLEVKVPFKKDPIKPYDWIMGDVLFGKGIKNRTFGKEENYYLGPNLDTRSLLRTEGRDGVMVFAGGKYFKYDLAESKFYVPEQIRGKTYLMREKSAKLQNIQGRERAVVDKDFEHLIQKDHLYTPKGIRGSLHKIRNYLELGTGQGRTQSIFSRLMNFAERKLLGESSDFEKSIGALRDKDLIRNIGSGYESLVEHGTTLRGALDFSVRESAGYTMDSRFFRMLGKRSKINVNLKGVKKNISEVLEGEKDILEYWNRDLTSAPDNVVRIINKYNQGDRRVLSNLSRSTRLGKSLTGLDELKFELLERELIKNAEQGYKVFGESSHKFINDLAKETGMSQIALTAINNLGLNAELKALFQTKNVKNLSSATINKGGELIKEFAGKMKEFDNTSLLRLNKFLTKMVGYKKTDDRLYGINKVIADKMRAPYVSIESSPFGIAGSIYKYALENLADMGGHFGLGMDLTKNAGVGGLTKYWTKRALLFAGIAGGYNIADTFFDSNPLFNKTMLDEGLTVALAEQAAKGRLAGAKLGDLLGITKGAQYMEGLMPGSTTFLPGAAVGGALGGPVGVLAGGFINRALATYFNYDTTRNYEELRDIYSGREKVAVRKGRAWELSKTPFEGGRISYYRPSWFHLLKSQYKNTPVLYGGNLEASTLTKPWFGLGFNPLGALLDPYRLERKQYFARPYPTTAPFGEDMPLIGPTVAGTVGKILKPIKRMHPREMQSTYNGIQGGEWDIAMRAKLMDNKVTDFNSSSAIALRGGFNVPLDKYDAYSSMGQQIYNFTEAAGLMGFLAESTILGGGIGEGRAVLESANRMSSIKRSFWDMELGGGLFTTEFWRRMIPRERQEIERRNPLRNMMPSWLPGGAESNYFINFREGDPYTKVPLGEARLPGFGIEAVKNIKYSFPGRASMIGKPINDMVSQMLGINQEGTVAMDEIFETGSAMHRAVQNNLKKSNLLVKAEADVYDVYNDISGHVDAVINDGFGGGGRRAVEIKTINAKGFEKLRSPKREHTSQLNFYLDQLKLPTGNLVYVNRDDPSQVKSFNVYFSKNLLQRDISKLKQARVIAENLLENDVRGQNIGNAYSHLDRLEILGDVAPWSNEYKSELKIVNAQRRAGLLDMDDNKKLETIKKHRSNVMRRFDFYPRRFSLDQLMDPDPTYTQMNINEDIKAAAEYSLPERALGSIWESFTHADLPIVNKFFGHKSPLEHYRENVLYGSKKSFWQKPYESFIDPAIRGMLGQENPIGGAAKFAMPGFLLGGPVGAFGAAGLGALYGGARGIVGGTYIPGMIQKQREISTYFDELEYEKNKRLHGLTGDDEYLENMQNTIAGYSAGVGKTSIKNLFRAVNRPERDYLSSFLKTTDSNDRDEILRLVPNDLSDILKSNWGMSDNIERGHNYSEEYFRTKNLPDPTWAGWSPHLPIEDYKVQTIKQEGLDAHDIGLGWSEQERRIRNSPWKIDPININAPSEVGPIPNRGQLESVINSILRNHKVFGSVSVIPISNDNGGVNLTINGTIDRRKDILRTIRGY